MESLKSIDLMLTICLERHSNPKFDAWARRFILGIDRTENSWINAQKNWEKGPWEDVHMIMCMWYDSQEPGRSQQSKDYLTRSYTMYLKEFFLKEGIPKTQYEL